MKSQIEQCQMSAGQTVPRIHCDKNEKKDHSNLNAVYY